MIEMQNQSFDRLYKLSESGIYTYAYDKNNRLVRDPIYTNPAITTLENIALLAKLITNQFLWDHDSPQKVTLKIESAEFMCSWWRVILNILTVGCWGCCCENSCCKMSVEKFQAKIIYPCNGTDFVIPLKGTLIDKLAQSVLGKGETLGREFPLELSEISEDSSASSDENEDQGRLISVHTVEKKIHFIFQKIALEPLDVEEGYPRV